MKNVFKTLSLFFITGISFFLFSVGYSQTNTNTDELSLLNVSLQREARTKVEFMKKLDAIKTLVSKNYVMLTCQQFDLLRGGSVNCNPTVLSNIQKKLDDGGLKRYRVVNLSSASLPPLDMKTVSKLKMIPHKGPHALKFPVGYPVYATMGHNFFVNHKADETYEYYHYIPALCYLNAERVTEAVYQGTAVLPTEDNIVSFIKYFHDNGVDGTDALYCGQYQKEHAVKYETEFLLQYPRW